MMIGWVNWQQPRMVAAKSRGAVSAPAPVGRGSKRLAAMSRAFAARALVLLCAMFLFFDQQPASAQTAGTGRSNLRRICDFDITIRRGERIQRDANQDRQSAANCTGEFTVGNADRTPGTPSYARGRLDSNTVADATAAGRNDTYTTYGTTRPLQQDPDVPDYWYSKTDTFGFYFQADNVARSAAVVDTFAVEVHRKPENGDARAWVYYHVTILPPAPSVTQIAPTAGTTAGGTTVVITGTNLDGATAVTIGGVAVTSFRVDSATQITAVTSTGGVGAKRVAVTTPGGTSTNSLDYTYYAPPTNQAAFAPASVQRSGNAVLTFTLTNPAGNPGAISGLSFSAAIPANLTLSTAAQPTTCGGTVSIGGGTISFSGGGSIAVGATCAVSANATSATPGSYSITPGAVSSTAPALTGVAGTAATLTVTVPPPTIAAVAPASGPAAGGTSVTIDGTNLDGASAVTFGGQPATPFTATANRITATAPAGSGTVDIVVTTAGGSVTRAQAFTYIPAPTVTRVTPASGMTGGGTMVTIAGTNLTDASAVTFGTRAATNVVVASGGMSLTATTPSGSAGPVAVVVTTPGGTGTLSGGYTYVAAPAAPTLNSPANNATIRSNAPTATGTAAAGSFVTVYVDGTPNGSGTATGGTFSIQLTGLAEGIRAISADARPSAGSDAVSARSATNSVTVDTIAPAPPVITTPAAGAQTTSRRPPIGGTAEPGASVRISIDGQRIGDVLADGGGNFSYTPTADLALGQRSATALATDPAGNASAVSAPRSFTIVAVPVVGSISPTEGPIAGGTVLTITGSNLADATGVTVGGRAATGVRTISDTSLSATTPAGTAGSAAVVVTNAAGNSNSDIGFTYVGTPTANAQSVSVAFNAPRSITLTGSDPNSPARALTYAIVTPPAHGTLAGNGSGRTYTPTTDYVGPDSFTFTVDNGTATSAPATVTLTVGKGDQTIAFTSTAPTGAMVGGPTYSVTATASSGLSPVFTSATGATCTVSGSTVSFVGVGSCTIDADQAGDARYNAAPRASQSFAVRGPTIAVTPETLPGATVGAAYRQSLGASGGTAPYRYSLAGGTLPTGLTLDGAAIAGTPTAGGSFTFEIRAQDSATGAGAPYSGTRSYTMAVAAPQLALSPAANTAGTTALPGAAGGQPYSTQISATGGTAPYRYTLVGGALPGGLTLGETGAITGTPTAGGDFTFRVRATDASTGSGAPYFVEGIYGIAVTAPTITIAPPTLPGGTVGTAYAQDLGASGGTGPYAFTASGSVPPGLTLTSAGRLSGTPTAGGSFAFRVTATDAQNFTGTRDFTLAIAAPTITVAPEALPGADRNVAYTATLRASGGTAPYRFAATGAVPPGLTLAADGTLSGRPTTAGSFTFTATATDSSGGTAYSGSRDYTLAVAAPAIAIAPATLADATTRVAYDQILTASGGAAPYRYAVTAGALPAGFTLAADGRLSGTTTTAGSFAFTATATDANGNSGERGYRLTVAAPAITIAPDALPGATTRTAYSQTLVASSGAAPYRYAVTAGALPAGFSLAADGTLSGTTTTAGSFNFTATATDANGNIGNRGYTLAVSAPALTIAPATLPAATTRVAYSQTLTTTGGTAPYAYAVTRGALPAGITLGTGGTLSGTATASGSFAFTATATDANGNTGARDYTLAVSMPAIAIAPSALPGARAGTAYDATLTASGGTAPYRFSVTGGALPAGVTLAEGGALAGTPTAGGSFAFTVSAADANGNAATRGYTLAVDAAQVAIGPDSLATGTAGTAYGQTLTATGGTAPYGFSLTAGRLPTGVTLSPSGALSGTPNQSGSFTFSVTATDASTGSGPYRATRSYTIAIGAPALVLSPATLPDAATGAAYSETLTASGGTAPYSYTITAGALPVGVTLSSAGTLSGTPTTGGSFAFTVTATDASTPGNGGPYSVARSYTLNVFAANVVLAPATLPAATAGSAYAQTITASGGTAPYGYTVSAGALPAGLTLSGAGALSGTPTTGGSFTFTVTATDASGGAGPYSGSRSYTLTVQAAAIAVSPATLPEARQGVAYDATVSASGGTAPYTFAVTAGRLPAGVTLSSAGALSGTPGENGSFPVSITATDASGGSGPFSGTRAYTLVVGTPAVPTAGPVSVTVAYGSTANPVPPALGGGTANSVAIATAPQHGTATASGTTITYTPAAGYAGRDSFTYTASNDGGTSAPATVGVTVTGSTVTLTPATLPAAQQDVGYTATLTASGGAAPYRFAVTTGRLPAGLSLAAGGGITGTPSESGSFALTVTATDSSTGEGPFSATRDYVLTVALPAAPVAQNSATRDVASTPQGGRSAIDIDLSALVSGNVTDIRIADQPRNGTVTVARAGTRFVATYVPRVDYRGQDAFSFVAQGPGGTSAAATVPLNVTGVAPVAVALRGTVENGQSVTIDLTTGAGGGPFTAATVVSISPTDAVTATVIDSGTGNARAFALRIAPVARFSGTATVTYTLSNAFGTSAPATVTVAVTARADPSRDATVTALSTAQVEAARRFATTQIDNFTRRNEQLHNGGGAGGSPMGISFGADLGIRPGGSGGSGVPGAQDTMSDVLAMKMEHATAVRGAERSAGLATIGSDGRLLPMAGRGGRTGLGAVRDVATGGLAGGGLARGSAPAGGMAGSGAAGDDQTNPTDAAERADDGPRAIGSTAIWSGGAVAIGMRDATTQRARLSISSGGLSAGIDVKLAETLTLGVGGGYGADRTRVGRDDRSRVDSDSWMGAAYGSFSLAPNAFVDAVVGGGGLRFDSIRTLTGGTATARGRRDGSMLFASLSSGFDRTTKTWRLSAYGRVDYLDAALDAYAETGAGTANLRFAKRDLTSLTGLLGMRGSFVSGRFVPRLRAEYRHEFKRSGAQALDYADLSGFGYAISDDRWLRDALSAELGTDYLLDDGWQLGVELGGAVGSGAVFGTGRLSIRKQF